MASDSSWRARNLSGSPFYTGPEWLDADSLIGRAESLRRLEVSVGGSRSSRLAIWGEPGSGRQALAGALRRSAEESGYLTAALVVGRETNSEMLGLRILDALYPAVAVAAAERGRQIPVLRAIRRLLLQAHGFEELDAHEREPSKWDLKASLFDLPTLFRELAQEAEKELSVPGFVVHLEYRDDLRPEEVAPAAHLFRGARDLAILVSGYHYLVSGRRAVLSSVLSGFPQVSSIFSSPVFLEPLREEELWHLLERRAERLALDPERPAPVPVEREAVMALYRLLEGNLEATLQALEEAVGRIGALASDPTSPLPLPWLAQALRVRAVEQVAGSLASGRMTQLGVLAAGFAGEPFTQKEARELWSLSPAAASEALSEMVRFGGIRELSAERTGRGRPRQRYQISGAVRLAFQSDALLECCPAASEGGAHDE